MSIIATCLATGELHDWTPWMECSPRLTPSHLPWRMARYRRLAFGTMELARITEYAMPSGLRQYVLSYSLHVRSSGPYPKFESYAQAFKYLQEVLP